MYFQDPSEDLPIRRSRIAPGLRPRAFLPLSRDDEDALAGAAQALPDGGGGAAQDAAFEARRADLEAATDQLLRAGGLYRGGYRDRGVLESMLPDFPGPQDEPAPDFPEAIAVGGPPARGFGGTTEARLDGIQRGINAQRVGLGLDPVDWRDDRAGRPGAPPSQAAPWQGRETPSPIDRGGPSSVMPNAQTQFQLGAGALPLGATARFGPGAVGRPGPLARVAEARAAARERLGIDPEQIDAAAQLLGQGLGASMRRGSGANMAGFGGYTAGRIPSGNLGFDPAVFRPVAATGSGQRDSPSMPQPLHLARATSGVSETGPPRHSRWQPELTDPSPPPRQTPRLDADFQRLAEVLSIGEGNYESYNSGTRGVRGDRVGHSFMNPPAGTVTGRTVNEILATASLPGTDRRRLFAVGRYQITQRTLRGAVAAMRLTGDERFTPELQDRIFAEYLVGKAGGGVLRRFIVNGTGTADQAQYAAAREWASIAVPRGYRTRGGRISDGTSTFYDETPANRASVTATNAMRTYLTELERRRQDR